MSEIRGIFLVVLGLMAIGYYFSWWLEGERLSSPWLILALVVALFYGSIQILLSWFIYLATHRRKVDAPTPATNLTVDVFVTACGESHALIERALEAACNMRGEHRTWLLDDGHDPLLAQMAARLGAGYLTRQDRKNAKAGNINSALPKTDGDLIVIFDIDHAPEPEFLERTTGYFKDPKMGFVQVMLTFENGRESWVARAAGESSQDFYNPISIGADGVSSATLIGTNAIIRRAALESIGGYQPGLAEDLETSIALHAAGWRSGYVSEPLAPGYAPPDLTAWFTQQFKWARGVFETLLTAYPRYFSKLATGQRLFYPVRMTYYWVGTIISIHLGVTLYAILFGGEQAVAGLQDYLEHLVPLSVMALLIRLLALRRWRHRSLNHNFQWKPIVLVYATWPVYTMGWLMTLLRIPLGFRPTPKAASGGLNPVWLLPQLVTVLLLLAGITNFFVNYRVDQYYLVILFALAQTIPQLLFFGLCLPRPSIRRLPGLVRLVGQKLSVPK